MPTIHVLSKNKKNIKNFHLKIIIFTAVKNCSILHGHVFLLLCHHVLSHVVDVLTTWDLRVMPEQISTTWLMEKCIIQFIVPEVSFHRHSCIARV